MFTQGERVSGVKKGGRGAGASVTGAAFYSKKLHQACDRNITFRAALQECEL